MPPAKRMLQTRPAALILENWGSQPGPGALESRATWAGGLPWPPRCARAQALLWDNPPQPPGCSCLRSRQWGTAQGGSRHGMSSPAGAGLCTLSCPYCIRGQGGVQTPVCTGVYWAPTGTLQGQHRAPMGAQIQPTHPALVGLESQGEGPAHVPVRIQPSLAQSQPFMSSPALGQSEMLMLAQNLRWWGH